jgi:uncharacterized NAD(P)/FAD-binding protein YdhS
MYTPDDPAVGRAPVIAVIGGGASGTLATIFLLREAAGRRLPLRIALIDRHGFPPSSAYGRNLPELLAAAERSARPVARVSRITSQVVAIRRGRHGHALRLHLAADGRIDADAVVLAIGGLINGTGPAADITTTGDPLLRHLLDSGLARPDPLRLGLDADAHGALRDASGRPASDVVTLGPLLRGRWYETTATPEIPDQAAALARHLLITQAHAGPGSAA